MRPLEDPAVCCWYIRCRSQGMNSRPFALAWILLAVVACGDDTGDDTCTSGENMTNPRVTGEPDALSAAPELRIAWDAGSGRGNELPPSYFDAVSVAPETDAAVVDSIAAVEHPTERELAVRFHELSTFAGQAAGLGFTLQFPDRRGFIDCTHPGMEDRYLLDVQLTFDAAGKVTSSQLTERVQLGDI